MTYWPVLVNVPCLEIVAFLNRTGVAGPPLWQYAVCC